MSLSRVAHQGLQQSEPGGSSALGLPQLAGHASVRLTSPAWGIGRVPWRVAEGNARPGTCGRLTISAAGSPCVPRRVAPLPAWKLARKRHRLSVAQRADSAASSVPVTRRLSAATLLLVNDSRFPIVSVELDADDASAIVAILLRLAALIDLDDPDGLRDASGALSPNMAEHMLTDTQFAMLHSSLYRPDRRAPVASRLRIISARIEGQLPDEAPDPR